VEIQFHVDAIRKKEYQNLLKLMGLGAINFIMFGIDMLKDAIMKNCLLLKHYGVVVLKFAIDGLN